MENNFVDTGLNTLKGARIKRLEQYIDSDVNMITYGDGVIDLDITKLVEYHNSHGKIITITGVHPPARFGEIVEKNGKVISFEEKPQTSSGLINGGYMVFNRELLNYLSSDEDADFEFGHNGKVSWSRRGYGLQHKGQWECMDHERDVVYLNRLWNDNSAFWKNGEL